MARQQKHGSDLPLASNKINHHTYENTRFNVIRQESYVHKRRGEILLKIEKKITRITRILSHNSQWWKQYLHLTCLQRPPQGVYIDS